MQVHIDVQQAQEAVNNIQHMARGVADECRRMLKNVKHVCGDMQTEMGDSVRKVTVKVERDISHLREEMQKLDNYMRELAGYIEQYSRCAYDGFGDRTYANVDTDELVQYNRSVGSFLESVDSFRYNAEETASRNAELLEKGANRLVSMTSECRTTLRYLRDKIQRAQARVNELESKLRQLNKRFNELQEQIKHYQSLAQQARARAAAVVIPPYRSRTVTNSDGSTHTEDNQAEIDAALARKTQYLNEAAKHEQMAARLMQEAEQVRREIEAVERELARVKDLLANMQETREALEDQVAEMDNARETLKESRSDIQSAREHYRENCYRMQEKGKYASTNLQDAERALGGYEAEGLPLPQLESIWDAVFGGFT